MSTTISIEEAQVKLREIIGKLAPGDEVVITEENKPVAQLRPVVAGKLQPQFGNCKGMLTIVAEDGEHLEDFKEYMP